MGCAVMRFALGDSLCSSSEKVLLKPSKLLTALYFVVKHSNAARLVMLSCFLVFPDQWWQKDRVKQNIF